MSSLGPVTDEASAIHVALVKTWPLVIINSGTPQEAVSYLQRQLPHLGNQQLVQATRFAYELHAAFRFFEQLEEQLTWAAYSFLQPLLGFRSVIWLHDVFFHEYGRRVGMVPRSSLKEEGNTVRWWRKGQRQPNNKQNKTNHSPQAETPPSSSISSVLE